MCGVPSCWTIHTAEGRRLTGRFCWTTVHDSTPPVVTLLQLKDGYSADGRCRCRFVADRCSFAARRRRFDPRVGLVARRRAGSGARPSATRSASLTSASSRLRSWDRRSEAVTVITPATRRRPRRVMSSSRCSSESTADSTTFHESSTRLSEVLTCWPPGPDERENRQPSSDDGIVSAGNTSRSMQPALHNVGPIEDPNPDSKSG